MPLDAVVAHVVALGGVKLLAKVLQDLDSTASMRALAVCRHAVDHGMLSLLLVVQLIPIVVDHASQGRDVAVGEIEIAI